MMIRYAKIMLLLVVLGGCKKPKPIVFTGQLLLSAKKPVPIANGKISIYQGGGEAILSSAQSSSASTVTDANGRFSITFVPGSSYFFGFSGENTSPLTFGSWETRPPFFRENFSQANYDASKPIYIGKTIDQLIVKVYCFRNIIPSDTFALSGQNLDSGFYKKYTGLAVDSLTTFTLDTVYNVLFTHFNSTKKTFANTNVEFGTLKTSPGATDQYFNAQNFYGMDLSAEDENKKEMTFNLYKN